MSTNTGNIKTTALTHYVIGTLIELLMITFVIKNISLALFFA